MVQKGLVLGAYSEGGCVTLTPTAQQFDNDLSGALSRQLDMYVFLIILFLNQFIKVMECMLSGKAMVQLSFDTLTG